MSHAYRFSMGYVYVRDGGMDAQGWPLHFYGYVHEYR